MVWHSERFDLDNKSHQRTSYMCPWWIIEREESTRHSAGCPPFNARTCWSQQDFRIYPAVVLVASIAKDIEDFCVSCGKCQTSKGTCQKPPGWLHTIPIPSKPWKSIGMDFSGPYPEVQGYNYILVVICQMTNMVHLIPTCTDVTAKDITEI